MTNFFDHPDDCKCLPCLVVECAIDERCTTFPIPNWPEQLPARPRLMAAMEDAIRKLKEPQ